MNRNYNSKKINSKNTSPLITALYCRLSLEDGKDNESMSISNQKLLLKDFAEKNGMFNCEFYVDDGFTGWNFNRPAFQRMINDIEAGRIGCVITKDLSRLVQAVIIVRNGYVAYIVFRGKHFHVAAGLDIVAPKEAFYGRLSRKMERQRLSDADSLKREYESLAQRSQEIDDTFISLYADKAKGALTEKRFLKLTDAMESEQESCQKRMQEIAALISEEEHSEGDVQMFMGEIKRYAAITELDETVLNRLINRILIGKPEKVDGVRTQEVRIVYNFIGEL